MGSSGFKKFFVAGAALGALVLGTHAASAGGIGIREQSASGQGMSFAGEGTSSMGLSAMFWNPAAVTQATGLWTESHTTFLFGNTEITPNLAATSPTLLGLYGTQSSGNISEFAYIPASYAAYRVNQNLFVGLSVNSPIGSGTHPDVYSGAFYANEARLKTVAFNPVIGWKFNDQFSIAAGPSIVWLFNGKFSRTTSPVLGANTELNNLGDWAVGWTAGLTWTPSPLTEFSLGYRSRVDATLKGNITAPVPPTPLSGPVTADATLPDQVNFGVRQKLDSRWTALGTVEWTHWSTLQNVNFILDSLGVPVTSINFLYKDGWFFSGGLEYQWDARTTLRGGIAYEISPERDQFRLLGVPDDNRWWFSAGMTQKWTERLTFDIGYSFVWLGDSPVNYTASNPNSGTTGGVLPFVGTSHSYYNIVSVGLRYKFDSEPAAVPLIRK